MLSTPGRALVDLRFSGTSPGCSPRFVLFLFVPSVSPSLVLAVSNLYRRCGTPPATGQIIHYEARACTRHVAHGESRAREMGERCGGRPTARRHPSLRERGRERCMGVRSIFPQRRTSRGLFSNERADRSRQIMHAVHQHRRNFLTRVLRRIKNPLRMAAIWTIPPWERLLAFPIRK